MTDPDFTPSLVDTASEDFAEAHSEFYFAFDPVEQGYYDDDPSPYDGNYSEM